MRNFLGAFFKMLKRIVWVAVISAIVTFYIAIYYPQGVIGAFEIFKNVLR